MATNTGKDSRKGSVNDRTQTQSPQSNYVKRDTDSGKFMDDKTSSKNPSRVSQKKKMIGEVK